MARMRISAAARRGGAGTRGGLGRIVAMATGLAVLALLIAAGDARAGLYQVAQCGWGVGAELDQTHPTAEGTAFSLNAASCVPPPGGEVPAMKFEAGPAPAGSAGLARARWLAPAGTSFRSVRLIWSGEPRWGIWDGASFDVGDGLKVALLNTAGPAPVELPVDGPAWAFELWFQCAFATPNPLLCDRSLPSIMRMSAMTMTLEDGEDPRARFAGPAVSGAWTRGSVGIELDASDVGAGVANETATVDGAPILSAASSTCAVATIEGQTRGTKLSPCPPTVARPAEIDTTRLADGPHVLRGCATDFSGGQGCAQAELEVDNSPPAVSFSAAADGEVAATVNDRFSGPASGTISVRRADAGVWTDLPTDFDPPADGTATLSARLPDLEAGSYTFRALAADAAGNAGSAQLRVSGGPAELRRQAADGHGVRGAGAAGVAPRARRRTTHLAVHLRPGPAVDLGTGVELAGRLTEARGGGVAGRPLTVVVRGAAGIGAPQRHRLGTGPGGRFVLHLPSGTSRRVTVVFRGSRGLAPARRSLTLRVRAEVSLAAEPTELRTGESVHLSGRVRLGPVHLSGRGKLVAIQYLEQATGRWRPALVVHTDAEGRFATSYRFRYVTGLARIRLRATAPAEGGWPFARGSSPPLTVSVRG